MKTISNKQKKELYNVEVKKEKQNESNETSINEMLSEYFIWFMKNNVEEFQMYWKFWNPQFQTNYRSL